VTYGHHIVVLLQLLVPLLQMVAILELIDHTFQLH